ncbi:MAG TPA: DUF2277 domain-containing protein [Candidatus Limnocylindria bacterium]|nr:DUF2277 domain-containing protein [Candidatus Limnocylindria bacterium]
MCRSIKRLRTIAGVAGEDEIRAAARQFVRKVSGVGEPTSKNTDVFEAAVDAVARASRELLVALPPSKAAIPVPRRRVR